MIYTDEQVDVVIGQLTTGNKKEKTLAKKLADEKNEEKRGKFIEADEFLKNLFEKNRQLYRFKMKKLVLEGGYWKITLDIGAENLSRLYMSYDLLFTPNVDSFKQSIRHERRQISEIEDSKQQSLLKKEQAAEVAKHEARIDKILEEEKQFKKENPEIQAVGYVVQMKRSNLGKEVVFGIPETIIQPINEKRFNIDDNYKLELRHINQ